MEFIGIVFFEEIERSMATKARPEENNNYLFIGLPDRAIPSNAYSIFIELQIRGYVPVIACVERNVALRKDTKQLCNWIANGILLHVGASSIRGESCKGNRKWALKLLRQGYVHFIEMDDQQSVSGKLEQQNLYSYLERKLPLGMVDQLKRNATYLATGKEFHSDTHYK